jgi:hypothetical protein
MALTRDDAVHLDFLKLPQNPQVIIEIESRPLDGQGSRRATNGLAEDDPPRRCGPPPQASPTDRPEITITDRIVPFAEAVKPPVA